MCYDIPICRIGENNTQIIMNNDKTDIDLVCKDCTTHFAWTAGEQKFMDDLFKKGKVKSVSQPKRCPPCRVAYKAKKDSFKKPVESYL